MNLKLFCYEIFPWTHTAPIFDCRKIIGVHQFATLTKKKAHEILNNNLFITSLVWRGLYIQQRAKFWARILIIITETDS